jgi:nucleotide-binding universal stress UspA family protein
MSYQVVLLPLFGSDADKGAIEAALAVARRFETEVLASFCRVDPGDIVPFIGEGVSPAVVQQLADAARDETDRQREMAREALERACEAAGQTIVEGRDGGAGRVRWLEVTGDRSEVVMAQGRLSDLVVFARPEATSDAERAVVETALLGSGRPILLVPPDGAESFGHNLAVAWNGSMEAARAVAGAMPFLEASITTHILSAPTGKTDAAGSADLALYLERHGVPVERHVVEPGDEPVGAALLTRATELSVDLLVLGGYSRSRFREMVLGGVTHHVLGHARLPILIAH